MLENRAEVFVERNLGLVRQPVEERGHPEEEPGGEGSARHLEHDDLFLGLLRDERMQLQKVWEVLPENVDVLAGDPQSRVHVV